MLLRPVQHRLAVEADHGHFARRNAVCRQICFDRLGVRRVYHRFRLGKGAGPPRAFGEIDCRRRGAAQQRALGFRIGAVYGRAEPGNDFAIGLDHGDVDAVLRGSAHQPNRENRR